ncbi:E3 ubiquitin-protein ligase NEURL1B isoform X1 [Clarias magur]|uniref:E3 ubiquitin-protein ligase NEURL1B isoform X1 n=1 Tax=Clarias magur TaxID=1594786 RepID=A0A8J4UKM3_CLAMG|nr:E3 ubiquitin-protein ligase NEURL1B isoform X1 [Clarias magur]
MGNNESSALFPQQLISSSQAYRAECQVSIRQGPIKREVPRGPQSSKSGADIATGTIHAFLQAQGRLRFAGTQEEPFKT